MGWFGAALGTYLLRRHGLLRRLVELLLRLRVVTEIFLAANEDDRKARAEMKDLGDPLRDTIVSQMYISSCPLRAPRTFS